MMEDEIYSRISAIILKVDKKTHLAESGGNGWMV